MTRLPRLFHPIRRLPAACKSLGSTVGVVAIIVAAGVALVRQTGLLQNAELSAYDALLRQRSPAATDERVLVVGIDEFDIQTLNEAPIADGTLARALAILRQNQPRVIGLDIARDVPIGEGQAALRAELERNDRLIAACVLSADQNPGVAPPPGVPEDRVAFADFPRDANNVVRRGLLVSTPSPANMPLPSTHLCNTAEAGIELLSLSMAMAATYLNQEGILLNPNDQGELQLGDIPLPRLGDQVVGYRALSAYDYQVLINYRAATDAVNLVRLTDVLNGQVNPEWIRDRMVLVGYTSDIAKDIFPTPFSGQWGQSDLMPGVIIHAQLASQLVSAALGERPLIWYWPWGGELLWIVLWAALGGGLAYASRRIWMFVLLEGVAIALLYGTCYWVLAQHSGWIPLVPPLLALMTTAVGVVLLDRANKEGYTQAVYEQVRDQVRVALKPKIEIDEEKRAKQVAEITETGYFKDLAARAREIRERRAREAAHETHRPSP